MVNVPLRNDIKIALQKKRKELTDATEVQATYSDVVLRLLEKDS